MGDVQLRVCQSGGFNIRVLQTLQNALLAGKTLSVSKPLHLESSPSLRTPPSSGISPISPEKCLFIAAV